MSGTLNALVRGARRLVAITSMVVSALREEILHCAATWRQDGLGLPALGVAWASCESGCTTASCDCGALGLVGHYFTADPSFFPSSACIQRMSVRHFVRKPSVARKSAEVIARMVTDIANCSTP